MNGEPNGDRDALLTIKEYAAIFRVTESAVQKAIKANRLPYPVERPLGPTGTAVIRVPADLVARIRR